MLKNSKFSIWVALMLAVILMGSFHPARALAQCGGGDHQSMHEQHMGSYGQMGMGSGQMGMSQVRPDGDDQRPGPRSGGPQRRHPRLCGPGVYRPAGHHGSGQMTGMDHSSHQH